MDAPPSEVPRTLAAKVFVVSEARIFEGKVIWLRYYFRRGLVLDRGESVECRQSLRSVRRGCRFGFVRTSMRKIGNCHEKWFGLICLH